jgi:hypothetical protein
VQADTVRLDGRRLFFELMGPGTLLGAGSAFDDGIRYVNPQCLAVVTLSTYLP